MNYILKTVLFSFVLGSSFFASSQDASDKKIQAGLVVNGGMNIVTPGLVKKIDVSGLGSHFSVGVNLNSSFEQAPTLGLLMGLQFDFDGFNYNTKDSIFYHYFSNEILGKKDAANKEGTFFLQERKIDAIYLSLPVMMIFKTQYIGDFKYFGKFGLRNSLLLKSTYNDRGVDVTNPSQHIANTENIRFESPGDLFIYKGSVGIAGGAEWRFIPSTSLVAEIGYYYGFTPMHLDRKENNETLYEYNNTLGQNVYFSNKATLNQLFFKLSLLF